MGSITTSAPGKLMLFGEHAALHGSACIVTTVNQRMKVTVEQSFSTTFELQARGVGIDDYKKPLSEVGKGDIPKGAKFVEIAVANFMSVILGSRATPGSDSGQARMTGKGLRITTSSEFSSLFGFGSSSAVTVCTLKALSEAFNVSLSKKELFDLAYKTVLDVQGAGSGFDVAAAIYGGTLYFLTGGKISEPLNVQSLSLIVGYSGVKADTVTIMNQVLEKTKEKPQTINQIYNQIGVIAQKAKEAIVKKDWKRVGELMNENQGLLQKLGVSTEKLDSMITAVLNAGAYGAKLSGAGGGDCMIGLLPPGRHQTKLAVQKAIKDVGGQVIDVVVNAEGVRIEP